MLRNQFLGSVSFFGALVVGLLTGWLASFHGPPQPPNPIHSIPQNNIVERVIEKDNFVPEFRELPDFEEFDFGPDIRNLIDVFERGGVYRESEVIAKNGESWLTLIEQNGIYKLKSSKAIVKKLKTSSYPGDEVDVRLTFDKPGKPVFAVKNLNGVKAGEVTTVYKRPSDEEIDRRNLPIYTMEDGYKRDFRLGDRWYVLRVSRGITKDGTKIGALVLEHEGRSQVIDQTYFVENEKVIVGDLLWAGDLDDDGKLDLYVDTYNEKGYFYSKLFLSSAAEQGQHVKIVSTFSTAGC